MHSCEAEEQNEIKNEWKRDYISNRNHLKKSIPFTNRNGHRVGLFFLGSNKAISGPIFRKE